MTDYVNKTDATDQNADSTGCGMAFLSWLMSQGYTLAKIAPTMVTAGDSGTSAQLYASLTANPATDALPAFIAAIRALLNGPKSVTNDDPFAGASHAAHAAHRRGVKPIAVCDLKSHRLVQPRKAKG